MRGPIDIQAQADLAGGTTVIPAGTNWSTALFFNDSDTIVYYQTTYEDTALTTSNGMPLKPGEYIGMSGHNKRDRAAVKFTHAATGVAKSVRYLYE